MLDEFDPRGDECTTFVNADIAGSAARTLRVHGSRIVDIGIPPHSRDTVVDLHGERLLPGLINAHDHLQLNGFPQLIYRKRYQNAGQWIGDVNGQLDSDPRIAEHRAIARDERLLLGGIKNLLSGVTTVAHHDPLYSYLSRAQFPVRVVSQYGWSHSLYLDRRAAVQSSHHETPPSWPWIIHAAEGTDADAAAEFDILADLECITPNTLLVHALGLSPAQQQRLARAGAGMIWCPSSNLNLFGATPDVGSLVALKRVALGSDSRISGGRDLLSELAVARECSAFDEGTLESLVTDSARRLLRLPDWGILRPGALADLLVIPREMPLSRVSRADIRLVMLNGRPCYGDRAYVCMLDVEGTLVAVRVDEREKFLPRALISTLAASQVRERGLEWNDPSSPAIDSTSRLIRDGAMREHCETMASP